MPVWLARAGKQGQFEPLAIEQSAILIGFDDFGDLSRINSLDELKELFHDTRPDASSSQAGNLAGQLWSFIGRMKKGDLVVLPFKSRPQVAIGRIVGDYQYLPELPAGARHSRSVEWLKEDIPRDDFGQDLLYSFGAFMTVCRIKRNDAESRIKKIANGKKDPGLKPAFDAPIDDEADSGEEAPLDLEQYALDQIINFISAKFKGHELTRLVNCILMAQGYETYISPPGPDGGVDILAGKGVMGFDAPRMCVQVKSGSGPVDISAIRELEGVMGRVLADRGLFVSWSGFKQSVYKEMRHLFFKVRLWDSSQVVRSLLACYDTIDEDIQADLPLKRVWTMVLDNSD